MTRDAVGLAVVLTCSLTTVVCAQRPTTSTVPITAVVNDSIRLAPITYISGQSVYVGAGRADGVNEGMSLDVVRAGAVIATIRAVFLSSHSSSCEVVASTALPAVGDSVRYRPAPPTVVAGANATGAQTTSSSRALDWRRGIRGHIGARYLSITQPNGGGVAITQPSADLHIEATHLGGTPLGFVVDGRDRRTIGSSSASFDERTRLYEISMSYTDDNSGTRLSLGRQYSAALSSVSLFDGFTAEVNRPHWGIGAFGGMQPDVTTMGYSTDIREYGGYLQVHNAPTGGFPWSVTTGAVDSRELGQLNREFGFAQVTMSGSIVSLYAVQEVDYNRGWKRAAGEQAISPTSSFATLQLRLADAFSVQAGVDNRRNVRLYRDYVSPETEFDDAFRQGAWAGANLSLFHKIRLGGDARFSRGGFAGDASYYTGSLGVDRFSPLGLDARARSTRFTTDRAFGWLHAWSAALDPFRIARVEVSGGLRTQHAFPLAATDSTGIPIPAIPDAKWLGISLDLALGRSWYILASGTRDGAGLDLTNQIYASLVFRF